jgi:hypothetical protein
MYLQWNNRQTSYPLQVLLGLAAQWGRWCSLYRATGDIKFKSPLPSSGLFSVCVVHFVVNICGRLACFHQRTLNQRLLSVSILVNGVFIDPLRTPPSSSLSTHSELSCTNLNYPCHSQLNTFLCLSESHYRHLQASDTSPRYLEKQVSLSHVCSVSVYLTHSTYHKWTSLE